MTRFSSADVALAQRIEAGHAHSGKLFAHPDALESVAGGWAVFQGIDSPMTQAIGIGMSGPVRPADLDRLEAFFHERGSPAVIDLCTLAEPGLLAMIVDRGYVVREISNVMVRRLDRSETFPDKPGEGIAVQAVAESDRRSWARLIIQGFSGEENAPEEHVAFLAASRPGLEAFFGSFGGARVSTAATGAEAGLATLFGDATLASARGHGLQLALIRHRLRRAAELGCDLASASVVPGGSSHRNYERAGFQLVYARIMVAKRQ